MLSKKVLGSVLAAALLTATVAVPVNAATGFKDVDAASNTALSTAVNRLNVLGIMNGTAADNFDKDADFTRAQAAKVFVMATGYGKIATGTKTTFSDVTEKWTGETAFINTANQVGLIKGWTKAGKSVFAPDDKVTYGQLATIAVRALGYSDDDLEGSWPYNYVAKATELGLFDDVEAVDAEAAAKRSDVALIANQMLQQHKQDAVADADGNYKTLLNTISQKLGVTTVAGVTVTATPAVDSTLTANQVKLDTTVYDATGIDASQLALGSKVDAFVKSGKLVLVSNVAATSVTQTVTRVAAGTIYYTDANSVEQSLPLDSAVKLYKNGGAVTALSTLVGTKASLIDNNGDGKYDYVLASYTDAPVVASSDITSDDVASVSKITYATGNVSLLKKADNTAAKVTVTGAATKLSQIKANDVIHVTKTDDNSVVNLFVVRNAVTGKPTLKTTDNKVTVNGAVYSFSANVASSIVLNTTNVFLLDKDNIIVGVTAAPAATVASATYGVVLNSVAVPATLDSAAGYRTRILKLDGTKIEVATAGIVTSAKASDLVYYTVDSTTGIATVKPVTASAFHAYNVVSTTNVYTISADGTTVTSVKYADLNVNDATDVAYALVDPNSTMKDYATLVFVNPALKSADTTGYGYTVAKVGETAVSDTVTGDVFSVFVNGVQQNITVAHGTTPAHYFSKLSLANGITTATAVADANTITGKVSAIDSARIMVGSTIYNLDANVKVYNIVGSTATSSVAKADTLSNVTTDMTNNVTIVTDATTGNVVEIVINK